MGIPKFLAFLPVISIIYLGCRTGTISTETEEEQDSVDVLIMEDGKDDDHPFTENYENYEFVNLHPGRINNPLLRSVQLYPSNQPGGLPVIRSGSADKLILSFDDLEATNRDYYYTIIHFDQNWIPSDISNLEYLDGFNMDNVPRGASSFGTKQKYSHYHLEFPNENLRPVLSGNYLLIVFREYAPITIEFSKRFVVVDPLVEVRANVIEKLGIPGSTGTEQEIEAMVYHQGMILDNPINDIHISVIQNSDWDHGLTHIAPVFVQNEILVFDRPEEMRFNAGKEYRFADIRSLRVYSERTRNVNQQNDTITAEISIDRIRSYEQYIYERDINGSWYISDRDHSNQDLQSEYALTKFTLESANQLPGGDVYIFGGLTEWKLLKEARMTYDPQKGAYCGNLYLKQGYYNYVYAFAAADSVQPDLDFLEGNYFETENDYTILVYYTPFGSRYDALIGILTVNSLFD